MSSRKKSSNNTSKSVSVDVQGKLNEFYKVAKEKLTLLKSSQEKSKQDYLNQKEINRKKELEYNNLLKESHDLDLKLKGMNEKLIIAKRNQNNLRSQIDLMKSEISTANREIDFIKLETDKKVKRVKDENERINTNKEHQLEYINERLDKEKKINDDLKEKIKDAEKRIKELMQSIDTNSYEQNKKNIAILKELADMNKFLSEL